MKDGNHLGNNPRVAAKPCMELAETVHTRGRIQTEGDILSKQTGWRAFASAFILSLVLLSLVAVTVVALLDFSEPADTSQPNIPKETYQPDKEENMTLLLMFGADRTKPPTTYQLLCFTPETRKIEVVPLPPELEATVNIRTDTLYGHYDYGGVDAACQAVQNALRITVNRYLVLDLESFAAMADYFGGLQYEVPEDINYFDPMFEGLQSLKKGFQLLDGMKLRILLRNPASYQEDMPEQRGTFLVEAINQCLDETIAENGEALFTAAVNETVTNLNHFDYTKREEALSYIAESDTEKAELLVLEGTWDFTRKGKRFTPSPESKGVVQTLLGEET